MLGEKRVALVIGNSDYQNVPRLSNPVRDAEAMVAALTRLGFEVLSDCDVAYLAFLDRIRSFGRSLRDAQVALFYYAGHGLQVNGYNYVMPVDAALAYENDVAHELIEVQFILKQMEIGDCTGIVILDACRDNLLARNLFSGNRSLATVRGLAPITSGEGTYIVFATAPGEVASDGTFNARNSPFTSALLNHIEIPGLSITDMMMRVRNDVKEATKKVPGGPQIPWENSSLFAPFYFVPPDHGSWPPTAIEQQRPVRKRDGFVGRTQTNLVGLSRGEGSATGVQHSTGRMSRWILAGVVVATWAGILWWYLVQSSQIPAGVAVGLGTGETVYMVPGTGVGFRDCGDCPEMVVVPAGRFMMGSPMSEAGHDSDEEPLHAVTIARPFAVGKFETTFAEWDACVADGWCLHKPDDKGWGRGRRPVFNVSWNHIKREYLPWLRWKTGKNYRLLTEAEWEYMARAGTRKPYWWGDSISKDKANYGHSHLQTLPVNSFAPNPWGLHQVHGNVWEWVQDCHTDNYKGAPGDGSAAAETSGCRRVLRGGSWDSIPKKLRSAYRDWGEQDYRGDWYIGFRLARPLEP